MRFARRSGIAILLLLFAIGGCVVTPPTSEIQFDEWDVDRRDIVLGESVTFSWTVLNAIECVFQNLPENVEETSNEDVDCEGQETRTLDVTTIFAIAATKTPGRNFTRSDTIEVMVNTDQPNFTNLTPPSLDLSATVTTSATGALSFDNSGTADLTYDITSDDTAIVVDSESGTVGPGDTRNVTITGTCSTEGITSSTITITTNDQTDGDGAVAVQLTCTATPEPDITDPTPNPLERVALVDETSTATVTFSNAGVADLEYSASESASWLSITAGDSDTVAAGASASIELELVCPPTEESLATTLTLTTNDPDESTKTVTVTLECQTVHPIWTVQHGSSQEDWPHGATADASGNIYVTGPTRGDLDGTNAGLQDVFLMKYDSDGNRLWVRQFGTSGTDFGYGVTTDASGDIFVTGWTEGDLNGESNAGGQDMFLVKYDAMGNHLWTRLLGTSFLEERAYSVSTDAGGNVFMTGRTGGDLDGMTNAGSQDIVLAKYDTDGNKLWTTLFGTSSDEKAYTAVTDASGNVYFTGNTSGDLDGEMNAGRNDAFVVKYDANGNRLWTRLLGSPADDFGFGLDLDSSGGIFISGKTEGDLDGINAGLNDMFVAKYDTDGNKLWSHQLGTSGDEDSRAVAVGVDGHAYVTGRTPGDLDGVSNNGGFDMFLVNYDSNGNRIWTDLHGTGDNDQPYWVTADASGAIFGTGKTGGSFEGSSNAGGEDAFLTKYGF